jgi:metallo-beta-lactamase class B
MAYRIANLHVADCGLNIDDCRFRFDRVLQETNDMRTIKAVIIASVLATAALSAQNPEVDRHVAAAKAAARTDHTELFTALCSAEPTGPGTGRRGGGGRQDAAPAPPAAETWHAEPMKVFDNLYFVGMKDVSAWAVTTSAGIIVIDALYDYSVDAEIAEGLKKVGLDPATIKYVIVSHGHGDHSAGAKYLQDRFKAHVLLSAADWDLLDRGRGAKPSRDLVATDGQKLSLGDTTITMYLTPGHTAGTLSYLIPVKDNGRPHLVAEWGGTAFNFPRTVENFRTYAASAQRFGDIVTKAGADAVISNHSDYDGSKRKLPLLAARRPGAPNPYVIGSDAVKRFMTVAEECARSWVERMNKPASGAELRED